MTTQDPPSAQRTPEVGAELVNPVAGSRTVFLATAASTDGAYVEVEQTYRPHSSKPPTHLHPNQDEHFTVVSGQLHAVVGDVESDLFAGDVLEVPRGVGHQPTSSSATCGLQRRRPTSSPTSGAPTR